MKQDDEDVRRLKVMLMADATKQYKDEDLDKPYISKYGLETCRLCPNRHKI